MLRKLTVSNLAIVERAEAEFTDALNVITGETGAGKSVLMGALGFVLGDRVESSFIRDGATEAEVEADFGEVFIRRTITAQGRSRAWVNDESVTIGELRELGRRLVDVHGPTANQRLVDERFQRETVDAFGGVDAAPYAAAWTELVRRRAELAALEKEGGADELDLLRYQIGEIEGANLTPRDETIVERHAQAAHAEEILAAANDITELLGGERGAAEVLSRLQPRFRSLGRLLPQAADWANAAEELTVSIQELSRSVADAVSRVDGGEEGLDELDERLGVVNRLKRKYGGSVEEILAALAAKKERLERLENRDALLAEKSTQVDAAEKAVACAGEDLRAQRRKAVAKFDRRVTDNLRDLGFLQAKFSTALEPIAPEPHGCDRVVFMFEPNPGESARPLADIASSGEIARVMLALKEVLAAHETDLTQVFDEIDANIGGEVGRIVGEKLRALARHRQVIAITHLPQSAAFGDRHLVVSKSVLGGRTRTRVAVIEGEDRVNEIARMLGGEKTTEVVRRHAQELLEVSR